MVTDDGKLAERDRYSSYGVPFGIPLGDVNGDGTVDSADLGQVLSDYGTGVVRSDLDLSGGVDSSDSTIASANYGVTMGLDAVGNSLFSYSGYTPDFVGTRILHVRHRILSPSLGRWNRRDPLSYIDDTTLYSYVKSKPNEGTDASGMLSFSQGCKTCKRKGNCGGYGVDFRYISQSGCTSGRTVWMQFVTIELECLNCNCEPYERGGSQSLSFVEVMRTQSPTTFSLAADTAAWTGIQGRREARWRRTAWARPFCLPSLQLELGGGWVIEDPGFTYPSHFQHTITKGFDACDYMFSTNTSGAIEVPGNSPPAWFITSAVSLGGATQMASDWTCCGANADNVAVTCQDSVSGVVPCP